MAAVIAAIVAAAIAGAIALYRERRIELRSFLVASRLLCEDLTDAVVTLEVTARRPDITSERALKLMAAILGEDSVTRAWEKHRSVLAAHLPPDQWAQIESAVRSMRLLAGVVTDRGDTADGHRVLVLSAAHDLRAASSTLARYVSGAGRLHNPGDSSREPVAQLSVDVGDEAIVEAWRAQVERVDRAEAGARNRTRRRGAPKD